MAEAAAWGWLGDAPATAARRAALRQLLGPLPVRPDGPSGQLQSAESLATGVRLERWQLLLNSEEPVPALLLLPADRPPRAVVLYGHAHGNRYEIGKDELLSGRPALQAPPYGEVLPALGIAVLAVDHWCFGARAQRSERAFVKQLLWNGCTLWGWRVHDTLAALDWLRTQPLLAGLPVAALGLSMGSTMAVWAAALDPRIGACIDLCCLAEYDALLADGSHDLHGEYFFVPGLCRQFSAAEIAALIAPRLHVSLVGRDDPLTPPAGVRAIDLALRAAYAQLGQPAAWQPGSYEAGHQETPAMRQRVLDSLERWIAAPAR